MVNILCVSDGSDDGYMALEVLARIIDRRLVDEMGVLMVTWPEREAPLWDKAEELRPAVHDLHEAMELTVVRELRRFQTLLQEHAMTIRTINDAGDPIIKVLEHSALMNADLILLAITSSPEATAVRNVSSEIIAKSSVPVVVVYGRSNCASHRRGNASGIKRRAGGSLKHAKERNWEMRPS